MVWSAKGWPLPVLQVLSGSRVELCKYTFYGGAVCSKNPMRGHDGSPKL